MRIKTVPVVRLCHRVPGPVGVLKILKDDARVLILLQRSTPDVKIAPGTAGLGTTRTLEPGMLIRRVIEGEFGDHPHTASMRTRQKLLEVTERTIQGVHISIVRHIIAVILE